MTVEGRSSKVLWNDSNARDVHANSFSVASTREEISLLFGTEPDRFSENSAMPIKLTNRIILSPFNAKQLAVALEHVLKNHELTYGPPEGDAYQPTAMDRKAKAAFLFKLVKDLDVVIGYEQSFKITRKGIYDHRFLLGVSRKEIESRAQERIIHICQQIKMPETLLEIFRQCLFDANYIHFGFEENENTCLYKVYVEFWDSIKSNMKNGRNISGPFLLHLGFKWDPFDRNRQAMTRYTWYPRLTVSEMLARAGALLDPERCGHVLEIAEGIVNLAIARIPHQDVLYIEVTEDGNPRKSFDINVYKAGLQIGELYPLLARLGQHYSTPYGKFHHLYDNVKAKKFGHLSGGVSRDGNDFCTVYYGVEPLYKDHTRHHVHGMAGGDRWPRQTAWTDPVEKTDEDAAMLVKLVNDLGVPFGFERSFKVMEKTFLPDRFLSGFERKWIAPEKQQESILGICRQINMPEDFMERFREDLSHANIALFGFEKNEKRRFYKLYLEYGERIKAAIDANPDHPHPVPIYTGFKWDVSDNTRKVVTSYTCYPALILKDMADLVAKLFYGNIGTTPHKIVEGILDLAANRAGPRDFLYFEASEPGNDRKSFSINVYRAGLRIAELYPLLLEMIRYYSVSSESFHRIYEAVKTMILGHVAGGVDREGRDFLTIYFLDKESSGKRPSDESDGTKGMIG